MAAGEPRHNARGVVDAQAGPKAEGDPAPKAQRWRARADQGRVQGEAREVAAFEIAGALGVCAFETMKKKPTAKKKSAPKKTVSVHRRLQSLLWSSESAARPALAECSENGADFVPG